MRLDFLPLSILNIRMQKQYTKSLNLFFDRMTFCYEYIMFHNHNDILYFYIPNLDLTESTMEEVWEIKEDIKNR